MAEGCDAVRADEIPIEATFHGEDVLRVVHKPVGRGKVLLVVEHDDVYLVPMDCELVDAALCIESMPRATGGMDRGAEMVPKKALQAVTPDSTVRIRVNTLSGRVAIQVMPALSVAL